MGAGWREWGRRGEDDRGHVRCSQRVNTEPTVRRLARDRTEAECRVVVGGDILETNCTLGISLESEHDKEKDAREHSQTTRGESRRAGQLKSSEGPGCRRNTVE